MLKKMRILLLVGMTAVLAACGGGDGGGDGTPDFAGRYFETLTFQSSTCGMTNFSYDAVDTVNQSGRTVSVDSDGLVMTGSVDGDNGGFFVSGAGVIEGTPVQATMKYRTVMAGSKYDAEFTMAIPGCTVTFKGTATKV